MINILLAAGIVILLAANIVILIVVLHRTRQRKGPYRDSSPLWTRPLGARQTRCSAHCTPAYPRGERRVTGCSRRPATSTRGFSAAIATDIDILEDGGDSIRARINGVDVFHPNTGEVRSDGAYGIAC